MLSHVTVAIADFDRAMAFYMPLMEALGLERYFFDAERQMAAFRAPGAPRPLFFVTRPFEGEPVAGNGPMVAFLSPSRALVDAVHEAGLKLGGTDEGAPGLRPHYHPDYYGAYLRDPDGNKICVVCHDPDPAPDS